LRTVKVNLGERSYDILVGRGLLNAIGPRLSGLVKPCKVALVTDEHVSRPYGRTVNRSLERAGFDVISIVLPPGEGTKSLTMLGRLADSFLRHGMDRKSLVVALGGGVIGDLAGFAAATFMRGIAFVQVPTSLLAQVDSSVGGKVAVNRPLGKNMVGAFHQPRAVFIDVNTLKTLPAGEYASGLAELVKHGLIRDAAFFKKLENNAGKLRRRSASFLEEAIARSVAVKARVVEEDEREQGLRAILNYGHTIGHALEAVTRYRKYRHGEAVAVGMACAGHIALDKGLLDEPSLRRQNALLASLGLPVRARGVNARRILDAAKRDKKVVSQQMRFILLDGIGRAVIREDVTDDDILRAIKATSK